MKFSSVSNTLRTALIAVTLGAISGVLAAALTTDSLSRYATELGTLTAPPRLSEERPRNFPESYAEALAEAREKVLPGIVEFFPRTNAVPAYAPDTAAARGIVLTSDGWILAVGRAETLRTMEAVVNKRAYAVERVVADPTLGVTFVKIEAENLVVMAFGEGFAAQAGEQVFVAPRRDGLVATTVTVVILPAVRQSDVPARRLRLATEIGEADVGAPVANLIGELVGVVALDDRSVPSVIPLEAVLPGFTHLLKEGALARPALGISYTDLSQEVIRATDGRERSEQGARVTAVRFASPAAAAGFAVGDVIVSMDGRPIGARRSLDEYLLDYAPGSQAAFSILRAGEQLELKATLGTR